MRALIQSLELNQGRLAAPVNGAFSSAPNGGLGGPTEPNHDFGGPIDPSKIKSEPGTSNGRASGFDDFSAFSTTVMDANPKVKKRKKSKVDEKEIVLESSSSDSERDDLKRAKKAKSVLDTKSLTTPSVTITPIMSGSNISAVLPGISLERRPGIEIIPFATSAPANLPSSITITPIPSDSKDIKKRNFDDRERKKKRKRDEDSKMGPPDKVPNKSDPLTKPVSVSIKPALDPDRPVSPSMRKYTSSPTFRSDKPIQKSNPSPKSSPVTLYSSPKHSPKHGTSSPKSGNSGKPSLSSMKTSGSPNSKSSDSKKSSSSSKDRDSSRKSASSPKIKSASVKLKPLDIPPADISLTNISPPPVDPKFPGNPLQRNRKGSLSAVIDKLKSAQEVVEPIPLPKDKSTTLTPITTITKIEAKGPGTPKPPDGIKNPSEYMVKHSLDGIKITINKTKSKDGSKGPSSKTHTGLKPGVLSGPASKKSSSSPSRTSGSPSPKGTTSSSSKSGPLKQNPSTKSVVKSSNSPKPPSDLSKKDASRSRPVKPEKSIFKEAQRKGSPTGFRDDDIMKTLKMDSGLPASMVKPLDTKFQIPKLSARNNPSNNPSEPASGSESLEQSNNNNSIKSTEKPDVKVIEVGLNTKSCLDLAAGLKYQSKLDSSDRMAKTATSALPSLLSLPLALTNISPKLPMVSPNLPTSSLSSITSTMDRSDEADKPTMTDIKVAPSETKTELLKVEPMKSEESTVAAPADILVDFSSSQGLQAKLAVVDKVIPPLVPLLLPLSPRATPLSPPSVTEDDLMDEALSLRK